MTINDMVDKSLFCALVDMLQTAIAAELTDEAETILTALRVVRPAGNEWYLYEGQIALARNELRDCIMAFNNLNPTSKNWSLAKVLAASCQLSLQDSSWELTANEVILAGIDPEAIRLAQQLNTKSGPDAADEPPRDMQLDISFHQFMGMRA